MKLRRRVLGLCCAAAIFSGGAAARAHGVFVADAPVLSLAWSPDGKSLAYCGYNACHIIAADDGTLRAGLAAPGGATSLAFTPDGTELITGPPSTDDTDFLALWSAQTGAALGGVAWPAKPPMPTGSVLLSLGADGKTLAAAVRDARAQPVVVFRLPGFAPAAQIMPGPDDLVSVLALAPAGGALALPRGSDAIAVYDLASGQLRQALHYRMDAQSAALQDLAFSPDGTALAAGFMALGGHGTLADGTLQMTTAPWPVQAVFMWHLGADAAAPAALCGKLPYGITHLLWPQRGKAVVATDGHGSVLLCPVSGAAPRRLAVPDGEAVPALSPDGRTLAVGDGTAILFFPMPSGA